MALRRNREEKEEPQKEYVSCPQISDGLACQRASGETWHTGRAKIRVEVSREVDLRELLSQSKDSFGTSWKNANHQTQLKRKRQLLSIELPGIPHTLSQVMNQLCSKVPSNPHISNACFPHGSKLPPLPCPASTVATEGGTGWCVQGGPAETSPHSLMGLDKSSLAFVPSKCCYQGNCLYVTEETIRT